MNVLIIRKVTNFELHGARTTKHVDSGFLSPDNLKRLKLAHDEHYATLDRVRESAKKHGLSCDEISRDEEWPEKSFDLVVTVGGDGTLLTASHKISGPTRLIGVRSSFSSVGFLCSYAKETIPELFPDVLENRIAFSSFARLHAKVERAVDSSTFVTEPVLNDFLFTNRNPAATSRYKITHNGQSEFQKSSGIWVSTAAGSSAAIHAAGGAVMDPLSKNYQFKVRELFQSGPEETLQLEGGFFGEEGGEFVVENRNESALLAIDGQHGVVDLRFGDRMVFEAAEDILLVNDFRMRAKP